MAARNTAIGTGVALVAAAGVTAAIALGATDAAQPLQPASEAQTQTQTQTTQTTTTQRATAHAEVVHRHRQRGRRVKAGANRAVTPNSVRRSDDGPAHDLNDDHGRGVEPGDDSGGHGRNRGHGGGGGGGDD